MACRLTVAVIVAEAITVAAVVCVVGDRTPGPGRAVHSQLVNLEAQPPPRWLIGPCELKAWAANRAYPKRGPIQKRSTQPRNAPQ